MNPVKNEEENRIAYVFSGLVLLLSLLKCILGRGWSGRKNLPSMEQKAMEEHLNLIHQVRHQLTFPQNIVFQW